MKIRLENIEKKVVASERNQPRIYLTKQEAQRFDLNRPVYITIEQDDYPVVDPEVIEVLNQKLNLWFQQQKKIENEALETFLSKMMTEHKFEERIRNEENILYSRNGNYINLRYPANSNQIGYPLFGFDDQIHWIKGDTSRLTYRNESSWWYNVIDFETVLRDLFTGERISSALVARNNGQILYISDKWDVDSEEVKKCINAWQSRAQFITLQSVKYSMLFSQPEHFSALNAVEKIWLVGAVSPEQDGERYFVLALTAKGVDGKDAYIDLVRAAYKMREQASSKIPIQSNNLSPQVVKAEQDIIADLEKHLGCTIPVIGKIEEKGFGYVVKDKHVIAIGLYDRGLKSLPESFWNLKSLQTLSLVRNKFTSLPETIGNLANLETLWLQENKLENLPMGLGRLTTLLHLNIWNNKLKSLPVSIGELKSLKTFVANNNLLESLPHSIGNLSELKEFNAQSNKLNDLPDTLGGMKSLQILNLSYNKLMKLPECIGNLSRLINLQLMSNQLNSLPETMGNLSALQILNVGDNWIKLIPENIGNLTALKELVLFSNNFPPNYTDPKPKWYVKLEKQGCIINYGL